MSTQPPKGSKAMRWMPLAVFALLAALMAAGIWLSKRPDRDALPSPLIDKPAPEFALPSLHEPARIVTLRELRGAPFVLNVWGSWCPECQVEHPVLTRFAERKRVRVVGYNWNDQREDALRWLEHFGNPYWLVVADTESRSAIDWGIYGAPETFLVDANGTIRWKHVGPLTDAIIDKQLMPALQSIEGAR
jgi:cytochrome c biogenesis protein CcmG/thiol:disulfide interchange protein DsbE